MQYTCSMCKAVCESEWSDAEAIAEKERDFGSVSLEDCDVVCDLCYQRVSPQNNPEYHARYLAMADRPIRMNTPLPTLTELEDTEVIRAYIDAELSRKLAEWLDREFAKEFLGWQGEEV